MNILSKEHSERDSNAQNTPRSLKFQDALLLFSLVLIAGMVRFGNVDEPDTNNVNRVTQTSEVLNDTDKFVGKNVTIRSQPVQQVGITSFTVNDQPGIIQEPLLIVNASGVPFDLPANRNRKIQVTGQVRNFKIPQIEREFNLNLQDKYYTSYINRPAIIAQSIRVVQ
ncbi:MULTISPECIES: hypothetical protein [unclassified Tolypothrix]|uniref:hypothetical protein n=1 Tax=unclassified Tolypothrix TaxID=2649714 RepID=UPI0005EAAE89|nr:MULTISPECIES: hypothetical protein [unclassified Tolypothrix]BAY94268.1 hypothetical protein NIES3275_63140 [Microchaete diplosiphon NIES-3275]EKF03983.1 hypothetical protein FDUTEX481_02986 [Tolypothrix sp. PCC 7601]MBE9085609.1 hypothetical protein [Tolypothrix sp. LEGE 11397]UYD28008.1 hypothetical protein HGR01_08155 [Tolypothrix sp. PCC 7712]UYD36122.1 hypothetical protein HG267_10475 [Tolypothrix sp. PCC 7601]